MKLFLQRIKKIFLLYKVVFWFHLEDKSLWGHSTEKELWFFFSSAFFSEVDGTSKLNKRNLWYVIIKWFVVF